MQRGPTGRFCCRWCGEELPRNRQSYCTNEHYHLFLEHNDAQYQRRKVWLRDQGVCALCATDTTSPEYLRQLGEYHEWRQSLLTPPAGKRRIDHIYLSKWEMDHIVPVVEGGGQCGLDNLRTLCIPCHRKVTRELRARLAGKGVADPSLQPALFEGAA